MSALLARGWLASMAGVLASFTLLSCPAAAREQGTVEPSAEIRADGSALRLLPPPALEDFEPAVREQLEQARAEIERLLATPSGSEPEPGAAHELADAFGRAGRLYLFYDRPDAAEVCLHNAALLEPDEASWHYLLGTLYQADGRFALARAAFEQTSRLDSADLPSLLRLGEMLVRERRFEEAARVYEQARGRLALPGRAAADGAVIEAGLGRIASAERRWAEAVGHYRRALELQPESSTLYHPLGLAYRHLGRIDEARAALAQAGNAMPTFEDPLLQELYRETRSARSFVFEGNRARRRGLRQLAASHYRRAIELDPGEVTAHYNLGVLLGEAGRVAEAEHHFRQATEHDPEYRDAWFNLAVGLRAGGRLADAVSAFDRAVALDPEDHPARLERAATLFAMGQQQRGTDEMLAVWNARPEETDVLLVLARYLHQAGHTAELESILAHGREQALDRGQRAALESLRGELGLPTTGPSPSGRPASDPPGTDSPGIDPPGVLSSASGSPAPGSDLRALCEAYRRGLEGGDPGGVGEQIIRRLGRSPTPSSDGDPAGQTLAAAVEHLHGGRPGQAIELLEPLAEGASERPRPWQLLYHHTLAQAHLQAAEDANCQLDPTASSCVVPLAPGARHAHPESVRAAGDAYARLLELEPRQPRYALLLNLARLLEGAWPEGVPPELRLPADGLAGPPSERRWEQRPISPGSKSPESVHPRPGDLAGGAIIDDFDGDGRLDLVSTTWDPCGPIQAWRNDGRGGFEDVSEAWNLASQLGGLNLVHADVDGDGRLDLLVLRGGWLFDQGAVRNSLLLQTRRDGRPFFVDATAASGLGPPAPTQVAAFADVDLDGDLDLFLGNETLGAQTTPSQLFLGRGDGTFVDVTEAAAVANGRFVKGAAWGDYDNDGDPDLYVSNWGANRLYRNDGPVARDDVSSPDRAQAVPRFVDVAEELSVTEPEGIGFGTWFFDLDNDGDLDLVALEFGQTTEDVAAFYLGWPPAPGSGGNRSRIYRNDGGQFTDVTRQMGWTQPSTPMGANYGDIDNDGFADLYLGTGDPQLDSLVPNLLLKNFGGVSLRDITFDSGLGHLQKGHGVAFGDVDGDGDLDLFHQLGGFFAGDDFQNALFLNPLFSPRRDAEAAGQSAAGADWLTLVLDDPTGQNRFAIGARWAVTVTRGGRPRTIHGLVGSGGSFGGSSLQQEIGLGRTDGRAWIEIRWPDGSEPERVGPLATGRSYRWLRGQGVSPVGEPP